MDNTLKGLIDGAISSANGDVIKFDSNKAAAASAKIRTIASEIENSTTQLKGLANDIRNCWTGEAADNFVREIYMLNLETRSIGENVRQNSQKLDAAIEIFGTTDKKVRNDVDALPVSSAFKN